MLYLDKTRSDILKAKSEHLKAIECRIRRKVLGTKCSDSSCEICKSHKLKFKSSPKIEQAIVNFFTSSSKLNEIIIGEPHNIPHLNDEFFRAVLPADQYSKLNTYFSSKKKKRFRVLTNLFKDLDKIFDYEKWFIKLDPKKQYSAYHLAKNLNRRSCTYCNRTYTTTMQDASGGKLMRPQFDHWYPKSKYPIFALSFYNLIPSCNTCNSSSKGAVELDINKHVHPYIDSNQTNEFQFNYMYVSKLDRYHISVQKTETNNRKMLDTLKTLKVDTMYNAHHEELQDLIKLKQAYSDKYIEKMANFFPKSGLSKEEVYRLLFGVELDAIDFHKKPLSKFKSDILKKLEIID